MFKEDEIENKEEFPKEFVFLFLSMVISCLIVYFLSAPLYTELKIKKLEIAIKDDNIDLRDALVVLVKKIEVKKNEKNNIEKIKNLVSTRDNYEEYLLNIIEIANSKNIIISDLKVGGIEEKNVKKDDVEIYNIGNISFSASGGYSNFINFLKNLEKNIPLLQVNSIEIENEGMGDDQISNLNYTVEVSFFNY